MIGVGQLPNRLRPLRKQRRTVAYTRRRSPRARTGESAPRELFASPRELPTARVVARPRTLPALVSIGMAAWFSEKWRWLRPRTIPVAVALAGLLGTIEAMNQLSTPPAVEQRAAAAPRGPAHDFSRVRIVLQQ